MRQVEKARWMGVDVGGERKGFDVALLQGRRVVELRARLDAGQVGEWVDGARPQVVDIDSPRSCAPAGQTRRESERLLAAGVCGIRWTPSQHKLEGNPYYDWILRGLDLYERLEGFDIDVIECFPTASWTRWAGPRAVQRRSAWTRNALGALDLVGVPKRTNQDVRDAIAAALTARAYAAGRVEVFAGEIVVPA